MPKDTTRLELQTLVEALGDVVLVLDDTGRYLRVLPTTRPALARPAADLIGRTLYDVLPPDVAEARHGSIRRVLADGVPVETTYTLLIDGAEHHFNATIARLNPTTVLWVARDITARTQTEAALRDREAHYQAIFDNAPLGITYIAIDGTWLLVNPRFCQITGYTREQLLTHRFQDLTHPADLQRDLEVRERLLAGAIDSATRDKRYRHQNGSDVWVRVTVSLQRTAAGEPMYFLSVVEDTSGRIHVERRLAVQYAVSRILAEAVSFDDAIPRILRSIGQTMDWERGAFWRVDPAVNALRYATGWCDPELDEESIVARSREILLPRGTGVLGEVWASGTALWLSDVRDAPNPERYTLAIEAGLRSAFAFPVRDRHMVFGVVEFFSGQVRPHDADIIDMADSIAAQIDQFVERKRHEETAQFLAAASSTLASSLDDTTILQHLTRLAVPRIADWCTIHALAEDGTFQQLAAAHTDNRRLQIFQEMEQRYPPDLDAPDGYPRVLRTGVSELRVDIDDAALVANARDDEHLQRLRELQFVSQMCVPLRAGGRTLGALTLASAESGRHYHLADLNLAEDLARRAALAIDNARLLAAAQGAVQIRDTFLSVAAHELRTPITVMGGYTQLLQARLARSPATSAHDQYILTVMAAQTERLARLVNLLLDVTRLDTGHFELERRPMDLGDLARRLVEEARPSLDIHTMTLHAPETPLIVDGDEVRLEQVLHNLLQNAIKYSPYGGTITVTVDQNGADAILTVTDEGIGIPEEAQARLFGRFFRAGNATSAHIGGMGIGLYVVNEIVSRHGGTVTVRSAVGAGSTFTVRLPLDTPPD